VIQERPEVLTVQTCPQCQDIFTWLAVYKDGSALSECSGNGIHAAFAHIEQDRLASMILIPLRDGYPQVAVAMTDETMRPIFFRRRLIELNMGGGDGGHNTIHCLGWRKPGIESFTFIFEDGSIVISDDRNAV
jgi:hypothetical protein